MIARWSHHKTFLIFNWGWCGKFVLVWLNKEAPLLTFPFKNVSFPLFKLKTIRTYPATALNRILKQPRVELPSRHFHTNPISNTKIIHSTIFCISISYLFNIYFWWGLNMWKITFFYHILSFILKSRIHNKPI